MKALNLVGQWPHAFPWACEQACVAPSAAGAETSQWASAPEIKKKKNWQIGWKIEGKSTMRWIGTKSYFCFGNSIPLFLQPFLDDLDLWLHRLKGRIHGREIGHTSAWIHWRNEIFLGFTAINGIHRSTERGEVRGGITVAGNDELLELNDAGVEGGDERIERMPNLLEIHRRRIPRSSPLLWPMGLVQVWNAP